jgi:hypothetical protein
VEPPVLEVEVAEGVVGGLVKAGKVLA